MRNLFEHIIHRHTHEHTYAPESKANVKKKKECVNVYYVWGEWYLCVSVAFFQNNLEFFIVLLYLTLNTSEFVFVTVFI